MARSFSPLIPDVTRSYRSSVPLTVGVGLSGSLGSQSYGAIPHYYSDRALRALNVVGLAPGWYVGLRPGQRFEVFLADPHYARGEHVVGAYLDVVERRGKRARKCFVPQNRQVESWPGYDDAFSWFPFTFGGRFHHHDAGNLFGEVTANVCYVDRSNVLADDDVLVRGATAQRMFSFAAGG